MSDRLYRWHITYRQLPHSWTEERDVIAPELIEALRLAATECLPRRTRCDCCCLGYVAVAIEMQELIHAIWVPLPIGPREPTLEERAAAEIDSLLGEPA